MSILHTPLHALALWIHRGSNDAWQHLFHYQKQHCKATLKTQINSWKLFHKSLDICHQTHYSPYGSSSGVLTPSCQHTTQHPCSLAKLHSSRAISHSLGSVVHHLGNGQPTPNVQWISKKIQLYYMLYCTLFIFIHLYSSLFIFVHL